MVAWTSPKTWSFGEILTSTDMNTYVRDNTADLDARVDAIPTVILKLEGGQQSASQSISTTYTTLTGCSISITPAADTNKILIVGVVPNISAGTQNVVARGRIRNGSTQLQEAFAPVRINTDQYGVLSFVYLDSPGVTTSVTYDIQVRTSSGSLNFAEGFLVIQEVQA